MKLTKTNYFSPEANLHYFSVSQFKSFDKCEARTMAELKGEWEPEPTTALLVGSYVDAYFEGTLGKFKQDHPELFKRDGSLKAEYAQADKIIKRAEQDEMFMRYMSGKKQVIKTGKLFGYPWKVKIDSYHEGKAIVDLKVMKDFEPIYVDGLGKVDFASAWGYDTQGAVYQAIEGNKLPFVIAGLTKEKETDIELFQVPQYRLDSALKMVEYKIDRFADVKAGLVEPKRCEKCAYCRATKKLKQIKILEEE